MMFSVYPIDILYVNDNYVWAITPQTGNDAYVVDPGAAEPVLKWLQETGHNLAGILITHSHWDHVGGIDGLLKHARVPVWGPDNPSIPQVTHAVGEGDRLQLSGLELDIMAIPGHTRDHIAYYTQDNPAPALFCGDTLFAAGCGRVFNGTLEDLHLSLMRIAQLPADTHIYCAHEYTLANLRFAQAVEPENIEIAERMAAVAQLRENAVPSLPSRLSEEWATNPFLRSHVPQVARRASERAGSPLADSVDIFRTLRQWKDNF